MRNPSSKATAGATAATAATFRLQLASSPRAGRPEVTLKSLSMLGIEWCFFEAVGESTEAKWHYQPGIGSYRKINSYQHVGVGKGDFVKEDSMFGGEWVAVGKGSGSYVRIQTFQHVGLGHGDYDKEEITSYAEWKLRPCVIWLCMTLLVLLLALLAVIYWPSNIAAAPQKWGGMVQRAVGLGPTEYFNCDVDFADWKAAWSDGKKDWCCQNAQRGCQGGYDCDAGFQTWKATWSLNKKEWCCSHRGRGCVPKGAQLYDCDAGYEDWRRQWTQGQKLWCCTVYDRGCNEARIEVKYNCKTTAAPTTWTLQKQQWCCKRSGIGCNLSQHRSNFDCQADIQNVHSWQHEKRSFCCKNHDVGCAASFDCDAGFNTWQQGWSEQKKDFCCAHHHKGCPPPKVDCSGSPGDWSEKKQSYCCQKTGQGCPTTTTTTLTGCSVPCLMQGQNYNCEARINYAARTTFANQLNACGKAHSLVQKQCGDACGTCSLGELKCQALPVTKPFNCQAALQNWITSWSAKKKDWCCKHEMKGCGNSFCDNIEELHTWTKAKKAFCCRTRGNGCTGSRTPHLPPGPGYQWKHMKVDGLYTWVRHAVPVQPKPMPHALHVVHTTTAGFDCHDGYTDFVHAWSTSKKHWCCEHQGLACTGPTHPAVPLKLQHQWQKRQINGVWTWTQVRSHVTKTYDCTQGLLEAPLDKLAYCCEHFGKACN